MNLRSPLAALAAALALLPAAALAHDYSQEYHEPEAATTWVETEEGAIALERTGPVVVTQYADWEPSDYTVTYLQPWTREYFMLDREHRWSGYSWSDTWDGDYDHDYWGHGWHGGHGNSRCCCW